MERKPPRRRGTLSPEAITTLIVGGGQLLLLGGAIFTTTKAHGRRLDRIEGKMLNGTFATKTELREHRESCREVFDEKLGRIEDSVEALKEAKA